MSKLITLSRLKSAFAPLMALIDKKAESPSWSENDPTSKSYIADRPFYTSSTLVTILPEQAINNDNWNTINEPLIVGQTYTVTFNDKDYTCICRDYDGYRMLGNNAIYEYDNGISTDTGEPFACETNGNNCVLWFYLSDQIDTAPTVKITKIDSKVVKIPEQYLPPQTYVSYESEQGLTYVQMEIARNNIGAGTSNFSGSYNDLSDKPEEMAIDEVLSNTSTNPVQNKVVAEAINATKDSISLIDRTNGYVYVVRMDNGNLISYCAAQSIEITTMPTKTEYIHGEYFDPTGMVIVATAYDGTTREITDYTYISSYLTEGTTSVEITYTEAGTVHTDSVPVTVVPFDAATVLVDFEYTDNGDGTYTVTGWKGTYNGEASTEMIIPNYGCIIV